MNKKKVFSNLADLADKVSLPREVVIETPSKKRGGLMKGAFIGTALGAIAGLLFAPKAGSQTRKDVQKAHQDLHKQAVDKVSELTNKAQHKGVKAGRKATDTVNAAQRKAEQGIDKAATKAKSATRKTATKARRQTRSAAPRATGVVPDTKPTDRPSAPRN